MIANGRIVYANADLPDDLKIGDVVKITTVAKVQKLEAGLIDVTPLGASGPETVLGLMSVDFHGGITTIERKDAA